LGRRARHEAGHPRAQAALAQGDRPRPLAAAGALFALSAVLDPTFVSLAVVAGRDGAFWSVVAAHSVWVLVSQVPLVVLLIAMAGGAHRRFVARFRSWWERARPAVGRLVTGAALLVGAFFLLDSGLWLATGEFLVSF
jgi:cytochrome c biogenesis protein CcdA